MSLIEIGTGAEARAQVLNDNFDYLEELISTSVSSLDAKFNSTTGNISNITSNLATIQSTLSTATSNISSLSSNKVNKDLSNATPSATFKANTIDWLAPNYGAGYSVSSGWTATKAGWIYCEMSSSANYTTKVLIGGKAVAYNYQGAGDGRAGALKVGCLAFIAKGQVLTTSVTGSPTNSFVFYPCKGN